MSHIIIIIYHVPNIKEEKRNVFSLFVKYQRYLCLYNQVSWVAILCSLCRGVVTCLINKKHTF